MRTALVLAATTLALAGCATDNVEPGEWNIAEGVGPIDKEAIIYYGDDPSLPEHEAVVSLHYRSGTTVYRSPFCTGTLVDDDVVMTAAHCLDAASGGASYSEMSPSNLAIYVGDDPSSDLASHIYTVDDLEIYSGYNRRTILNDIAMVRLSGDITESVEPVPPLPASEGFSSSDIGEDLDFVGFGYTESGSYGDKQRVVLPLGGLGCDVSGCPSSGDDPDTQISYEQDDGGPCSGDSGGPAFVTRGGNVYVGGITSWGDYYCIRYGVSTNVSAFESFWGDWITADTGGGDGGGDGGSDPYCGDGTCGEGESCNGAAAGTDACPEDCDSRSTGPRFLRYCFVEGECRGQGCSRL